MKEKIHPKYNATVAECVCGAKYEVGSTRETIRVDICAACHPFFTGTQKILDAEGRVDRFKKRYAKAKNVPSATKPKIKKVVKKVVKKTTEKKEVTKVDKPKVKKESDK